jgi:hypothetical protein
MKTETRPASSAWLIPAVHVPSSSFEDSNPNPTAHFPEYNEDVIGLERWVFKLNFHGRRWSLFKTIDTKRADFLLEYGAVNVSLGTNDCFEAMAAAVEFISNRNEIVNNRRFAI